VAKIEWGALSRSVPVIGAAAALTLITWIYFDVMKPPVPLGPAATTIVAGFWLGLALLARVTWQWVKNRPGRQRKT
jgi:hypothetical protein